MTTSPARPGLPTVDQVAALDNGLRRTAPSEWEDFNGHVNVRHYYDFHMLAGDEFFEGLGVNEEYRRRHGQSTFSLEHHINFFDEVLVGHEVSCHTLVLNRSEKLLHAVSIISDHTAGRVVNTCEFVEAHVDLSTRRTVSFQPPVAAGLDRALDQHRGLSWTVPTNGAMGLR